MAEFQVGIFVRNSSGGGGGSDAGPENVQTRADYIVDLEAADAESGGRRYLRENLSDGLYRIVVGNRVVFVERHDVLRIEVYPKPPAS